MATAVFLPPALSLTTRLILGSLGMSQGQSSVNEKTQGGKGWGRETAGVSREQRSEEGHTEAGGSSGPEAGHHWPAATVLKTTTTAEAAEATRKNMQRHIKYTNITRYWVPAAWLSGYHSECPEQQGKGRKGVALPRQSPLSLASTCPSKMRGSETDYPGTGCSPCIGVSGENLKHACACAHQDTFPCCSAERRETVSCRN